MATTDKEFHNLESVITKMKNKYPSYGSPHRIYFPPHEINKLPPSNKSFFSIQCEFHLMSHFIFKFKILIR